MSPVATPRYTKMPARAVTLPLWQPIRGGGPRRFSNLVGRSGWLTADAERTLEWFDLTPEEKADILAWLAQGGMVELNDEYIQVRPGPERIEALLEREGRGDLSLGEYRREQIVTGGDPIEARTGAGRVALLIADDSHAGELRYDAAEAWQSGWFRDGFPEDRQVLMRPTPGMLVDCECDCGCDWDGRFDEADPDRGVLRCPDCVAAGHPPVFRAAVHRLPLRDPRPAGPRP